MEETHRRVAHLRKNVDGTKTSLIVLAVVVAAALVSSGCKRQEPQLTAPTKTSAVGITSTPQTQDYPRIASYITDLDSLITDSVRRYDLIYISTVESGEAVRKIRQKKPDTIVLYQSSLVYLPDAVIPVIKATTGKDPSGSVWLRNKDNNRVAYGMRALGSPHEYYAFDIRKTEVRSLLATHFSKVLEVASHFDGLFFDIVEETSRSDSVSDAEWAAATANLLGEIRDKVGEAKTILVNGGYYSASTPFLRHINGYNLEAFLTGSEQYGLGVDKGLEQVNIVKQKTRLPHFLVYNPYSTNVATKQKTSPETVRLVLALSLLNDETYLHYDLDPEVGKLGQGLWQKEFSAPVGSPLGPYFKRPDGAFQRNFTNGFVIASPHAAVTLDLEQEVTDYSTGVRSRQFRIEKGDGRIYVTGD